MGEADVIRAMLSQIPSKGKVGTYEETRLGRENATEDLDLSALCPTDSMGLLSDFQRLRQGSNNEIPQVLSARSKSSSGSGFSDVTGKSSRSGASKNGSKGPSDKESVKSDRKSD